MCYNWIRSDTESALHMELRKNDLFNKCATASPDNQFLYNKVCTSVAHVPAATDYVKMT